MGTVYAAVGERGERVAVKVVHAGQAADEQFRARFRREVQVLGRVSGPCLVPLLEADPEAETPWLATAYVRRDAGVQGGQARPHVRQGGPCFPVVSGLLGLRIPGRSQAPARPGVDVRRVRHRARTRCRWQFSQRHRAGHLRVRGSGWMLNGRAGRLY